jgi:hypothetical protein
MPIAYSIAIDSNDDGDFSDLGDTISAELLEAQWRSGMAKPYHHIAVVSTAEIVVRNPSGTFSPERTALLPGKRLKIQSDDGTIVRTHFIGAIARVEPTAGNYGERTSTIFAQDRMAELSQQQIRLPLMSNLTADEGINTILEQVTWRYDRLDAMCIIGRDSIGSSTIFGDNPISKTLDTGKSTFAYLGDNWEEGLFAHDAIRQLAEAEGGRFFFNRNAEAVFYNRHHLLQDNTVAATFEDDVEALVYHYGDSLVNVVEVQILPRNIGAANSLLWSLSQTLTLLRDSETRITANYRFDAQSVGALEIVKPIFTANSKSNGSGENVTSSVQAVLVGVGASAAILEIRNRSKKTVYLTQLELHGTVLSTDYPLILTAEDAMSKALYGIHALRMTVPVVTDIEEAQAIADWELLRHSEAQGTIHELQTSTRSHPTETLSLSLFDRIKVIESQTGHNANYHIVSEAHIIDKGGTRHRVSWLLEPAESDIFFVIGTDSIGGDKILAPR